jgi:hypothetical protein
VSSRSAAGRGAADPPLVSATAPRVVALRGVGIHTTAALLVTAGGNPRAAALRKGVRPVHGHRAGPSLIGLPAHPRWDRHGNIALHLISLYALRGQLSAASRWNSNADFVGPVGRVWR